MKKVVGVADMVVLSGNEDEITTFALGSCLGITIYDPEASVGGMLHVMLPDSSIDAAKAQKNPQMFVDTGVPALFRAAYALGAKKERIVLKVAGGACMKGNADDDYFQIGKRNYLALKKILWKNGVMIQAEEVGGTQGRTMNLGLADGEVTIKKFNETTRL